MDSLQDDERRCYFNDGIFDPLFGHPIHVVSIEVKHFYPSKTRPVLLEWSYASNDMSEMNVIYKVGDDLVVDMNVQIMFWIFNVIWANAQTPGKMPYIRQYRVLPTGLYIVIFI